MTTIRSKVPSKEYEENWEKIFGFMRYHSSVCEICGAILSPNEEEEHLRTHNEKGSH